MLKEDVSIDAAMIWKILSEKGRLTVREIVELTQFKEALILLSLGWLLKEGKVTLSDNDGKLYVEMNMSISETYY